MLEATTILEAAIQSRAVLVTCGCGRRARYWAPGLWWRFHRCGWNDEFGQALARFRCRSCSERAGHRIRPQRIEVVREGPGEIVLPEPEPRAWKRALSRFR
ncbi:hypothetical protein [Novosphingobium sp. Gsoil 351]|uniref:hypothetical protein n=1 Tax=Novosphingobium sp. Gsoil 351 TaxID=2675225 RepID=UPI0012B49B20|nr:hypothetical protein [Novosphingobium sp. Gsoil 351]QGN55475.1 hypothetical protein GKE62_13870 [Novosphingobium sp. Gsoil 351]